MELKVKFLGPLLGVTYFAVDFLSETGRRLLLDHSRDESKVHDQKYRTGGSDSKTLSTPKKVGVVAAGAVLACCLFICPCFYKKRKNTAHSVLEKDPNSSRSIFYLASCHLKLFK